MSDVISHENGDDNDGDKKFIIIFSKASRIN